MQGTNNILSKKFRLVINKNFQAHVAPFQLWSICLGLPYLLVNPAVVYVDVHPPVLDITASLHDIKCGLCLFGVLVCSNREFM